MAFNQTGATSLAYFKGEKSIDAERFKRFNRFSLSKLSAEQEKQAEEEARITGLPFIVCAEKVYNKQLSLEAYQK